MCWCNLWRFRLPTFSYAPAYESNSSMRENVDDRCVGLEFDFMTGSQKFQRNDDHLAYVNSDFNSLKPQQLVRRCYSHSPLGLNVVCKSVVVKVKRVIHAALITRPSYH